MLSPKRSKALGGLLCILTAVAIIGTMITPSAASGATTRDFSLLDLCLNFIERYYPGTFSMETLFEGAAKGLVDGLGDPYSEYLTPEEYQALMSSLGGSFGGLGIYIDSSDDGYIVIIAPIKGTPADKAGLKAGDKIATVDGQDFRGIDTNTASDRLRGEPGTSVKLGIIRAGVPGIIEFVVERALIEVNPVEYELLAGEVGYIQLTTFNENATEKLDAAVTALRAAGAKSIILDLRNNGGGLLNQALSIASRFVRKNQTILSIASKSGTPQVYTSDGTGYIGLPLAVIVNGGTASASEIVAGAIKDNATGQIVGTTTYGKGAIQNVWKFTNGGGLRLTTAHYYTPSGTALDGNGIVPQYVVEDTITTSGAPFLNWYREIRHMRVGLDVLELEKVLMFLGIGTEADGVYGLPSVNAVKTFQMSQRIAATGVVDNATAALLNQAAQEHMQTGYDPQLEKALELLGVTP